MRRPGEHQGGKGLDAVSYPVIAGVRTHGRVGLGGEQGQQGAIKYREGVQDWVEAGLLTERLHQPVDDDLGAVGEIAPR